MLGDPFEQLGRLDAQGSRDAHNRAEARIPYPAFEAADLSRVQVAVPRKRLLGQAPRVTQAPDVRAEALLWSHPADGLGSRPKGLEPITQIGLGWSPSCQLRPTRSDRREATCVLSEERLEWRSK